MPISPAVCLRVSATINALQQAIEQAVEMIANGYDESPVKLENTSAPVKSVGNSTTTPKDMETDEDVKIVLYILAESVAARLRENGFRCRTVEISVRDKELFHFSKQVKLQNASNITKEIAEAGYRLYKANPQCWCPRCRFSDR